MKQDTEDDVLAFGELMWFYYENARYRPACPIAAAVAFNSTKARLAGELIEEW